MKKPKISIAIIAKNEVDRISRLLKSVKFADEVLVVDSGSNDGTPDVCKKLGAQVFHKWAGYAAQTQFAMEHTSSEWTLNLDADEEILESLAKEMQHAKAWESGYHV